MAGDLRDGDLVVVKTPRGSGRFMVVADGLHMYLREVEPGTVRRIAGYGGCVMPAKPLPGVTVENVRSDKKPYQQGRLA